MMNRLQWLGCAAVSAFLAVVGCGSRSEPSDGTDFENPDHVRTWVNTGSALAVYVRVHNVIAFADGASTFADPACPVTSDDGTRVRIEGDCTDDSASEWVGTATVTRIEGGVRRVELSGFAQVNDPELRAPMDGSYEFRPVGETSGETVHEFDADFVQGGGVTTTIEYTGSVDGSYEGRTVWNGSGQLERDGVADATGRVDVSTIDEVIDNDVCAGQPVSGSTSIDDGRSLATVTYDGAVDCDDEQAARFSLDGEDRGSIEGIACALRSGASTRPWSLAVALGLLITLRRRRMNRRGAKVCFSRVHAEPLALSDLIS